MTALTSERAPTSPPHLFLGPTLSVRDALRVVPEAVVRPPVSHGDLLRASFAPNDVVVLVDGYYHHVASVRHKEILELLGRGVVVVGCSSMGAIRAAELERFGMIGYGAVFGMYRNGLVDADDEVALAHGEGPDYRRMSEPLVNIRYATMSARDAGVLSDDAAAELVTIAAGQHYTARSWDQIGREARARRGHLAPAFARLRAFLAEHPEHADIKAADAIGALTWVRDFVRGDTDALGWRSSDWRNPYLDEWRVRFGVTEVAGVEVSHEALVRYHQIYNDEFPSRWRRFVTDRLCEWADSVAPADRAATRSPLAAAANLGLAPGGLTGERAEVWLTGRERVALDTAEQLCRAMVRSYRDPHKLYQLVTAEPDLIADPVARAAVAQSTAINAEVASWRPGQASSNIRSAVLVKHLAEVWGLAATDRESLLAAARDRGFHSLSEATDAARMFYLINHFRRLDPTLPVARNGD